MSFAKALLYCALVLAMVTPAGARSGFWGPPVNVGAPINTAANELSGVVCPFSHALFFSRTVVGQNDLYVSYREGDHWGRPVPLIELNSPFYNDLNPTFAPDASRMYFVSDRAGGMGGFDVWTSAWNGSGWDPPEPLGSEVNTAGDEWYAAIGADGLYISARTEAGVNRGDIFMAAGTYPGFAPRTPLAPLSTPYREMSVFPGQDGQSLYITCNAPGTSGLDDIWVSAHSDGGWEPPVPVQCNPNSADYDQYPTAGGDGNSLMFASFNRPGGYGGADLYVSDWHELGDVNGDGSAAVSDIIAFVNYVFRDGPPPADPLVQDINCDGVIDIVDAVRLINYVLKAGPAPCINCPG